MKTVYYTRHAKSSWTEFGLTDIDRPLNTRGKKDAPFMASKLHDRIPKIDGIISSTSERTQETLFFFKKEFQVEEPKIILDKNLYHAPASQLIESLFQIPDDWDSVILFTHNPGITYFANEISDEYIPNIPTCGIFEVTFNSDSWVNLDQSHAQFNFFIYPKLYTK